MKRRISIADVARESNASITSVSRVMNDVDYPVSQELRHRILNAIERLQYTPNSAAQRLRSHFTAVIGIVVRDISNTYFGDIARGATDQALKHGHLTFICDTGRNAVNERDVHELLWKNRVRGIILVGGGFDDYEYRELMAKQMARSASFGLRLVSNAPQGIEVPTITVDFAQIMDTAVSHLIGVGHDRIAMVTGSSNVYTCQHHLAGFRRALDRHHIAYSAELTAFEGFTEIAGYRGCQSFLRLESRPTAICCASDLVAVGAMRAIHEFGLSVPQDVSLVGVGDSTLASYMRPALTTIRVPRYELGLRAVDLILGEEIRRDHREILDTELVPRESVRELSA